MIRIQERSATPIYEQIVEQMKELIAKGAMKPGEKVPSVRELSSGLVVNPNTVSKAYQELERQGVFITLRGKGTFISESFSPGMAEERLIKMKEEMQRLAVEAKHLGLQEEEFLKMMKQVCKVLWEGSHDTSTSGT
ncbi:GntR family transcriptional regulator [Paenibacillus sp. 481]|uniref:GntR family transcriptional regulator n=1 Tax=Paenibacillus sp. 481 TaxID=2835869 RepID=UPI001E3ECB6A|nr:GntR family transcriptional regulator [Paenibacillus sp. 481]UHA74921.1 GntR family transcriptional regulator [Paenibacillus sp. 481]